MENKTMMKLVVGTEAIFFLSLTMSFIYLQTVSGFEPSQVRSLNITSTGIFSLMLVGSSATFWLAEKKYKQGKTIGLKVWLLVTIILGMLFLGGQAFEYLHLVHKQVTISSGVFGTSFYALTGFHLLHVLIGLMILLVLFVMSVLGDFNKPGSSLLATAGIYWHFVDIVWIIVFSIIYVLPRFNILK